MKYEDGADYLEHPELLPHPIQSGIASKFVCIGNMNFSLLQALLRRDFPVALLECDVSIPGVTTIQPDYMEAARLAMDYLFKNGHVHIAVLSGPFGSTQHSVTELNRGIRLRHEHANVPFDTQNIIHGDLTFKSGAAAMDVLFSRPRKPTAIFCLGDEAAAGALSQARVMGIKVPDELSILGFSGNPISEAMGLSTVHLPAEEMGAEAVSADGDEALDVQARRRGGSERHGAFASVRPTIVTTAPSRPATGRRRNPSRSSAGDDGPTARKLVRHGALPRKRIMFGVVRPESRSTGDRRQARRHKRRQLASPASPWR